MTTDRLQSEERQRKVKVDVTTFKGLSIGAKHYYVEVQEEDDAAWNEERQTWVTSSARKDLKGQRFTNGDFMRKQHAIRWANMIVSENFSSHKIEWEDDEEEVEKYKLRTPGRY